MKTDKRDTFNGGPEAAGSGSYPEVGVRPPVMAIALAEAALAQMPRHVLAPHARVVMCSLSDLTDMDLTGPQAPELILAPLTAKGFDAMDLLAVLTRARFWGRVLVLTPHVPDVPLIRADVVAQAPGLNVDVIALDGSSALHLL